MEYGWSADGVQYMDKIRSKLRIGVIVFSIEDLLQLLTLYSRAIAVEWISQ